MRAYANPNIRRDWRMPATGRNLLRQSQDGAYFTKNAGEKQVGKVKITRVRDLALLVDGCWLVAVDMV